MTFVRVPEEFCDHCLIEAVLGLRPTTDSLLRRSQGSLNYNKISIKIVTVVVIKSYQHHQPYLARGSCQYHRRHYTEWSGHNISLREDMAADLPMSMGMSAANLSLRLVCGQIFLWLSFALCGQFSSCWKGAQARCRTHSEKSDVIKIVANIPRCHRAPLRLDLP